MVWVDRLVRVPVDLGEVFSEAEVQWRKPSEMTSLTLLKTQDNAEL
jgi:hypothetical protein